MRSAPAARWHVCHTRPRCEKKFAALAAAEGVEHYLPVLASVRRYPGRTKRFSKPLFPGYVFAQVPAERRSRMYQQDLLARLIPVTDEGPFLRQLADVRAIVASGYELTVQPLLARGRRVRVDRGPLRGLEGFVDDSSNPGGIVVSVDVLQQGLHLRLPAEILHILP
ncbi:MAG: UpxY family transcription antiterminator [Verrucomicrobia bacterium]|nr:UpxY family transcription antiterminator [Verrucomicrobiota bacterium]